MANVWMAEGVVKLKAPKIVEPYAMSLDPPFITRGHYGVSLVLRNIVLENVECVLANGDKVVLNKVRATIRIDGELEPVVMDDNTVSSYQVIKADDPTVIG